MLGNEFAVLVPHLPVHAARVLLYQLLDDGYGTYFDDIFVPEDREDPLFLKEIGSPNLLHYTPEDVAVGMAFLQEKGYDCGTWRQDWRDTALCDVEREQLSRYTKGEVGNAFVQYYQSGVTPLALKQVLLSQLECFGLDTAVFTPADMETSTYKRLLQSPKWWGYLGVGESALPTLEEAARRFLESKWSITGSQAPYVGVTFGWIEPIDNEWHVYGNLQVAQAFRPTWEQIPYLFGAACFEVPRHSLDRFYENTYLCLITSDVRQSVEIVEKSVAYECPMSSARSVKWIGKLPEVLGPWSKVSNAVLSAHRRIGSEEVV